MRDGLVVVGGSAGAVLPLIDLVAGLPPDFAGCVLVTLHMPGHVRSSLAAVLDRAGPLRAAPAQDGEPLAPGRIVVAVPDAHLLVAEGVLRLGRGPRVNRHRPAVDVTFTSAAAWGGRAVTAVVLSGVLDDGAVGAALVDGAGGRVVVQDPDQADHRAMPDAALRAVPTATVSPPDKLAEVVSTMTRESGVMTTDPYAGAPPEDPSPVAEAARAGGDPSAAGPDMAAGSDPCFLTPGETRLTRISCPECHGPLAEVTAPHVTYYRCHIGHQYGPQTLVAAQAEAVEGTLWSAVAALEEQARMTRHLAVDHGIDVAANRATADSAADLAAVLRARLRHEGP